MLETFYATGAQICFALLGLWWVVVQFKYDTLMRDPATRRTAYNISLYFVIPGAMYFLAVLSTDTPWVWQIAFVVGGVLGLIETVTQLRRNTPLAQTGSARAGQIAALALYLLILAFAIVPGVLREYGLVPRIVEGVLLTLLMLLGVQFAWMFFTEANTQ